MGVGVLTVATLCGLFATGKDEIVVGSEPCTTLRIVFKPSEGMKPSTPLFNHGLSWKNKLSVAIRVEAHHLG
jgi:hypothetical protein